MDHDNPTGGLDADRTDGVAVVRLPAFDVFDEEVIRSTTEQLDRALWAGPRDRVVVDLSALEMVTSRVLGMLLGLKKRLETEGGRLRLCGCGSPRVRDAFRVTFLDRVFSIDPDEATARARF